MARNMVAHKIIAIALVAAVVVVGTGIFLTRSKYAYQSMQAEITVTYENGQVLTYRIFARGTQENIFDFRMECTVDSQPGHTLIYNKNDNAFYDYDPGVQVWKRDIGLIADNVVKLLKYFVDNITALAQSGAQFPIDFPSSSNWQWSGALSAELNVEMQDELFNPSINATVEEIFLKVDDPFRAVMSQAMYHGDNSWENYFIERGYDTSNFPILGGFGRGDIIAVENVATENVKIGDVILFNVPNYPTPWVHRVVAINNLNGQRSFSTKGDNNLYVSSSENLIESSHVLGRVAFVIPQLGYPIVWIYS